MCVCSITQIFHLSMTSIDIERKFKEDYKNKNKSMERGVEL